MWHQAHRLLILLCASLPVCAEMDPLARFGQTLFFDQDLSLNRTQSCATCHDPSRAFTDSRPGPLSVGDDGVSVSLRNSPTLSYIALTPEFGVQGNAPSGGFFMDGRASTLADQAAGPLFDRNEMALAGPAMLRERLFENEHYVALLKSEYPQIRSANAVLDLVGRALAAFQATVVFAPADSKYDRYLTGTYEMTPLEAQGRTLFFSDLMSCAGCHELPQRSPQPFTDYRYHNIGTPRLPDNDHDIGLARNPTTAAPSHHGKFKTPTLRNIAVTAPYMHNGVFKELRTVLAFYNTYFLAGTLNPETNAPWGNAYAPHNISKDLLTQGQPLDAGRMRSVEAFLNTLTDARYEHLIPPAASARVDH